MPEPYWPKRKGSYRLSNAAKNSRYARLRCRYCKTYRYYLIEELKAVFGDIECDDVVYQNDWRCSGCGEKNMIEFDTCNPSATELQASVVRRIDRVVYVRKVIWKDGPD
ncbi:MAG: hypothetical protein K5872_06555 [Rhizobiaceae bacterium]|nr:hypothetical protein [Rhizobiaceae bacterium]MCV0405874.1 hypothetical protein [Rhizobiaceae bacterium]